MGEPVVVAQASRAELERLATRLDSIGVRSQLLRPPGCSTSG